MMMMMMMIIIIIISIITHAGCIAAGVGRAFSRVCLFVCLSLSLSLSVCPRSKKTASAINTELNTHILDNSRLACIDPEVKRSRSHGYENRHGSTVASDACCYDRVLLLRRGVFALL